MSDVSLSNAARAVVASWNSSTYHREQPDCLQVNVSREAWAAFCELVESGDTFQVDAMDLIAKADAMYRELYGYFKAKIDAEYQAEFGHNGPSLAGFPIQAPQPMDSANRAYVYWRCRFSDKHPDAPNARQALRG